MSPYFHGVPDGILKRWDEQGRKVGQHRMRMGSGVVRVYWSDGILSEEKPMVGDAPYGWEFDRDKNPGGLDLISVIKKAGEFATDGGEFFSNGSVSYYGLIPRPPDQVRVGPAFEFNVDGSVFRANWFYGDVEVTEAEYARRFARNPKLYPLIFATCRGTAP